MKNFVTYEWLLENMSNENLIILDARADMDSPDLNFNEYKNGHIKGAQFVCLEKTMTGDPSTHGGRHPLPNMETFIDNMKKLGINDDSTIVIYDDGDLSMAGRLWWLLKYSGKFKVYVLEGGIKLWLENNLELTTDIPQVKESDRLTLNIAPSMEVDINYVKSAIESDKKAIIDSRAYERYSGKVEPLDRVAGHIPNALNFPWMDLLADGKLINLEKAKDHFKSLKDYDEIIVHCGSGITGTVNIMLMEEIGLRPKFYVGGYSDWVSYPDNIVISEED